MKLAIIGSREIENFDLDEYIGDDVEEIVSGGARGIDTLAAELARERGIAIKVFLPNYERYGRCAPIKRNYEIVDYADEVLAIWDGKSRGTRSVIDYCDKKGKKVHIVIKNQ